MITQLNTPENRAAFVTKFGPAKHPSGPWCVDDKTAGIVLGAIERDPERYRKWQNLWSYIMQNRATFMLGEIHIYRAIPTHRVTEKRYEAIGQEVTTAIYEFCAKLKGCTHEQ